METEIRRHFALGLSDRSQGRQRMKNSIEKALVAVLPSSAATGLGVLYGYLVRPKKSYSQYCEDLIVKTFFTKCGIKNGFYIDIGAYHPRFISNTYLLHKKGWGGVAVDLDAEKLRWFKRMRGSRVSTVCAGINGIDSKDHTSTITFYKHRRLLSEIDTLDQETAIRNHKTCGWSYSESQVPTFGINEFLAKYADRPIDLLNIDVEGKDGEIIQNLDFERFTPKVILFEDNSSFGAAQPTRSRLESHGYEPLFACGGSVGYYLPRLTTQRKKLTDPS